MAKQTLLELTVDILSDMNSDVVNSINDTAESLQVAYIIRDTFDNIVSGKHYPHKNTLLSLEASGTTARPTHMRLPESVIHVESVRYNKKLLADTKDKYLKVLYKSPEDFLTLVNARNSDESNVETIEDLSGISLYIINDIAPTYYTTFDDEYLVFDSYDVAVDSTLQENKTQCYGAEMPSFTMSDSFIPDIPIQLFPYLLNESKSTAFLVLKQMPNQKAEQHSVSQRRRMSQDAWRATTKGISRPNYGRTSKK